MYLCSKYKCESFKCLPTNSYWSSVKSRHCIRFWEHRDERQSPYLLVGKGITDNYSTETQNDLVQLGHQNRLIGWKFDFVGSKGRDDRKFMCHVELLHPSTWDLTSTAFRWTINYVFLITVCCCLLPNSTMRNWLKCSLSHPDIHSFKKHLSECVLCQTTWTPWILALKMFKREGK